MKVSQLIEGWWRSYDQNRADSRWDNFARAMNAETVKTEDKKSTLLFDKMCRIYINVHKLTTVLPFEGRDLSFIGSQMLTVYFVFFSIIHWSMFLIYCYNTSSLEVEDICEAVLALGVDLRYYMWLCKRKTFASILKECRELWEFCNEEGKLIVLGYEHKLRQIYQFFYASAILVNVTYAADAVTTRLPPLEPNGTERRALPYNWYADNTENNWPGYWVIFLVQLLAVQNATTYAVTCDSTMPLLAMICSGYFKHLQHRLFASQENQDPTLRKRELRRCTYFHQRLLKFCSKLAILADVMLLTQVLSTAYNISLILIKLVSNVYKYVTILGVFVCQLQLIHWAPDYLYDESEAVALNAYYAYSKSSENPDLTKYFLIIITRAQKPVRISAGGVFSLSLESFGKMIKSAFSFFTVLRNMNL